MFKLSISEKLNLHRQKSECLHVQQNPYEFHTRRLHRRKAEQAVDQMKTKERQRSFFNNNHYSSQHKVQPFQVAFQEYMNLEET